MNDKTVLPKNIVRNENPRGKCPLFKCVKCLKAFEKLGRAKFHRCKGK